MGLEILILSMLNIISILIIIDLTWVDFYQPNLTGNNIIEQLTIKEADSSLYI